MSNIDYRKMVIDGLQRELERAQSHYPAYHSTHEGYAVIREELDELWDNVKREKRTSADGVTGIEALQVATTAVRFILDLCDESEFRETLRGFEGS